MVNLLLSCVSMSLLSVLHQTDSEWERKRAETPGKKRVNEWMVLLWRTTQRNENGRNEGKKRIRVHVHAALVFIWADFDALCGFSLVLLHGLISLLFIVDAELWFVNSSCNDMAMHAIDFAFVCSLNSHSCTLSARPFFAFAFLIRSAVSLSLSACMHCITVENGHVNHYDSTNIKLDYVVHSQWHRNNKITKWHSIKLLKPNYKFGQISFPFQVEEANAKPTKTRQRMGEKIWWQSGQQRENKCIAFGSECEKTSTL